MWKLLLLLLVGTACAQESGDYEQENGDQLMKVATNEDNIHELFDEYNEDELDEEDLSLSQESDHIEPDFTEKAEHTACPDKGTYKYHIFQESSDFHIATNFCHNRSGNLSSVHNFDENSYLQSLLKESVKNTKYAWLGVWKKGSFSNYRNLDGSNLDYVNWGSGQRKLIGEWCVAMKTNTGQWFTHKCNKQLPFVCTY
ncbi:snaclec purpureotin subunit beta-like [Phyllobates terribilis]|uniref:snaclec purpureotin subunit beta-like n=1 Tax=Phyllobates terribilis TaxID=111132 RepID=UPI003CCAE0C9